jgi:hypothetical protein
MTFTKEDIERWISELAREHEPHDYDERFKFGFGQGLVAVRAKMDDEIKARRGGQ